MAAWDLELSMLWKSQKYAGLAHSRQLESSLLVKCSLFSSRSDFHTPDHEQIQQTTQLHAHKGPKSTKVWPQLPHQHPKDASTSPSNPSFLAEKTFLETRRPQAHIAASNRPMTFEHRPSAQPRSLTPMTARDNAENICRKFLTWKLGQTTSGGNRFRSGTRATSRPNGPLRLTHLQSQFIEEQLKVGSSQRAGRARLLAPQLAIISS